MPAFFALIFFLVGLIAGEAVKLDYPSQGLVILICLFMIMRLVKQGYPAGLSAMLIAVFFAGLIRSSFPAFSVIPQDFLSMMENKVIPLREKLVSGMGFGLNSSQKELIAGIILGRGSGTIEVSDWPHFVKSGMSHLLVASGAQVSLTIFPLILVAENFKLSQRIRNIIFFSAGILLFILLLLVGQEPSILRAITACYFYLIARLFNRKASSLNIIYFTALIWLWIDPALRNNIGFRLSYSASWGLIYLYPRLRQVYRIPEKVEARLRKYWIINKPVTYMYEIMLLSFSAQVAVLPILAYHFHCLSPSGFVANMIAIPVSEVATYIGLASAIMAQVSTIVAFYFNQVNSHVLFFLDSIARFFSVVPFIHGGKTHWIALILPYFFIGLLVEARFSPHSLVLIMQKMHKIAYPMDYFRGRNLLRLIARIRNR